MVWSEIGSNSARTSQVGRCTSPPGWLAATRCSGQQPTHWKPLVGRDSRFEVVLTPCLPEDHAVRQAGSAAATCLLGIEEAFDSRPLGDFRPGQDLCRVDAPVSGAVGGDAPVHVEYQWFGTLRNRGLDQIPLVLLGSPNFLRFWIPLTRKGCFTASRACTPHAALSRMAVPQPCSGSSRRTVVPGQRVCRPERAPVWSLPPPIPCHRSRQFGAPRRSLRAFLGPNAACHPPDSH